MRVGRPVLAGVLSLIAVCASSAAAQEARVSGVVLEADGSTRAAYIALLVVDSAGAVVARGQSSATGTFTIPVARPGTLAVRALRVGFAPSRSGFVTVRDGATVAVTVQLEGRRVTLPAVAVRDRSLCSASPGGGALLDVWDQARAALLGVVQVHDSVPRIESVSWRVVRRIWPDTGTQVAFDAPRRDRADVMRSRGAADLIRNGFVRTVGDSVEFHAPDAFVLLDPDLASAYCFWLEPSPAGHDDWVGLGVRSNGGGIGPGPVEGVLWLTPDGQLQRFDFRYVGLDQALDPAQPGGRVEFMRLATGQWVVSRWHLRMPEGVTDIQDRGLGVTARRSTYLRLGSVVERGAFVSRVFNDDGSYLDLGHQAFVLRLVATDGSAQPLEGTRVRIPAEELEWTADAKGRVSSAQLRPGSYLTLIETPLQRDAGLAPDTARLILVPDTAAAELEATVATPAEIRRRLCGTDRGDALALGTLHTGAGSAWVSRASEWESPTAQRTAATVDSSGRWRACAVPRNVALVLWTEREGAREILARFRVPRAVDLAVVGGATGGGMAGELAALLPTQLATEGSASMALTVMAARDSTVMRDVQVVIDDSLLVRPDSRGRYRVPSLDVGMHTLMIRRIGFTPVTRSVQLASSAMQEDTVYLERLPQLLTEVRIRGRDVRVPLKYVDVLRRSVSGWGTLFTREDLEHAMDVRSVLWQVPGVRSGGRDIAFERCRDATVDAEGRVDKKVQVYIDGVRVTTLKPPSRPRPTLAVESDMDPVSEALRLVHVKDIEFIEVFRGTAQIPAEFNNDACAVIAIWTKLY